MAVAKPITVPCPQEGLNRRKLLMGLPLAGAALALPIAAKAESDRDRMIRVVYQLEAHEGWESANVVAAMAFAAWQIRKALGLTMPDPKYAQMHVDFQKAAFERYRQIYIFSCGTTDGEQCSERALA
ncbi:hypothetical protein [uncultured Pseudosulfitobacter sp.]|uniref:hypothetical protein n=1 Tax=uncultured Pseudosulfitobacter sp. TaxID=2854214 RepID=UPI0030DCD7C3|tara:strand:- start:1606 stop:1986 length:381 start_codon:yes stop_codon:yes gene_type:complete